MILCYYFIWICITKTNVNQYVMTDVLNYIRATNAPPEIQSDYIIPKHTKDLIFIIVYLEQKLYYIVNTLLSPIYIYRKIYRMAPPPP